MRNNQNDSFRDNMLQHTTFICSVPYYPTIFINYACVLSRLLALRPSRRLPSNSPIFSRQRFRSAATSPACSLSKTSALSAIRCLSRTVSRVRSASFESFLRGASRVPTSSGRGTPRSKRPRFSGARPTTSPRASSGTRSGSTFGAFSATRDAGLWHCERTSPANSTTNVTVVVVAFSCLAGASSSSSSFSVPTPPPPRRRRRDFREDFARSRKVQQSSSSSSSSSSQRWR